MMFRLAIGFVIFDMPEEAEYWVLSSGKQKSYRQRVLKFIGELHKSFSPLGFSIIYSEPKWIGAVLRKGDFWQGTSISLILQTEDPIEFQLEFMKRVKKGKNILYISVSKNNLEYFEENIEQIKVSINEVLSKEHVAK